MVVPDRVSPTPNYSDWPAAGMPQAVMIHSTRSGRSDFTDAQELSSTLNWFMHPDSRVSSHWVISGGGEKVRVVPDDKKAWHCGNQNSYFYGIELTQPTIDRPYTDDHYRALVEVCRPYLARGVPVVKLPQPTHNGMQGFTGHENSQQGISVGKSDPGPAFDWTRFLNMLREEDDMVSQQDFNRYKEIDNNRNTRIWQNLAEINGAIEAEKQTRTLVDRFLKARIEALEQGDGPPSDERVTEEVANLERDLEEYQQRLAQGLKGLAETLESGAP